MASTNADLTAVTPQRVAQAIADRFLGLMRFFRQKPLGAFGALILLIMVVFAVFAGPISRFHPQEMIKSVERVEVIPGPDQFDFTFFSLKKIEFERPVQLTDLRNTVDKIGHSDAKLEMIDEVTFVLQASYADTSLLPILQDTHGQITAVYLERTVLLRGPSSTYWLGTDDFARDVFSRIVHGSILSLRIGFTSVILGTTLGALLGMVSGYVGGRFDMIVQRVMDALMALPSMILALMVVAALSSGEFPVIVAIALSIGPNANRLLRAQCLTIKERPYVEAAKALGASDLRVMMAHIVPNSLAPFLVIATAGLGAAILVEASLSFLGFGVPPPAPSWGGMLTGNAQQYALTAPWLAIAPGVAISLAVFGFNVLGDALRDVWDPRLRGR